MYYELIVIVEYFIFSFIFMIFYGIFQVNILITDVNDNSFQFQISSFQILVWEDEDFFIILYMVYVIDLDSGSNGVIFYSMVGDSFNIFKLNSILGEIILFRFFDYE